VLCQLSDHIDLFFQEFRSNTTVPSGIDAVQGLDKDAWCLDNIEIFAWGPRQRLVKICPWSKVPQ
jgi:hypothetical protein